jgi:hypothetical protein
MKHINISGFLLVLILFLLPFMQVSCSGDKIASYTGRQLVMGFKVQGDTKPTKYVSSELRFVAGAAIVGAIFSFVGFRRTLVFLGISLFGTVFLLRFQESAESALGDYSGMATVDLQFGFWLCLTLFAGLTCYNAWLLFKSWQNHKDLKALTKTTTEI